MGISIFIQLTCLSFLLVCYFIFSKTLADGLKVKLNTTLLLLLFFSLGFSLFSLKKPSNNPYSLENTYLKGDLLIGKVNSISLTQSGYSKIEFQIFNLLRNKDTVFVRDKALIFAQDSSTLKENDVCVFNTNLELIRNKLNPGEFDSEFFWNHKDIYYLGFVDASNYQKIGYAPESISSFFLKLRTYFSSILETYLKGNELGVAKALILGDRTSLDSEITEKFGTTGAMHVLAVSGLHIGILIQILTAFFGLFSKFISKNKAILISLVLIWMYALLTGFSASVVRSVLMFSLLVGSKLLQKNYNDFNVLAFSALLILVWNPQFLFDIGFQLSYLAMMGIYMFYKPLSKLVYIPFKPLRLAYEGTMVGIAAQITTVPFTLYYFHQFPNYFILTNLGLMVFSFVILVLGVALFTFKLVPFFAKYIALALFFSLTLMLSIVKFIDALPFAVASGFVFNELLLFALFLSIVFFYYSLETQKISWLIGILAFSLVLIGTLVVGRYNRISKDQICFLQSNEPTFIVKNGNKNFVFYANKNYNKRKATFLAKSFQKIYSGQLQYIEISKKKSTSLKNSDFKLSIVRERGGYAISLNGANYFYVTNLNHSNEGSTLIYAPWIDEVSSSNSLKNNPVQFFI